MIKQEIIPIAVLISKPGEIILVCMAFFIPVSIVVNDALSINKSLLSLVAVEHFLFSIEVKLTEKERIGISLNRKTTSFTG
jgi:hypothetical protein